MEDAMNLLLQLLFSGIKGFESFINTFLNVNQIKLIFLKYNRVILKKIAFFACAIGF